MRFALIDLRFEKNAFHLAETLGRNSIARFFAEKKLAIDEKYNSPWRPIVQPDQKASARVEVRGGMRRALKCNEQLLREGPCYSYSRIADYTAEPTLDRLSLRASEILVILRMKNSYGNPGRSSRVGADTNGRNKVE